MGYILLSKDYLENVEIDFQSWHLFDATATPNYTNKDNKEILHTDYKINNIIPLCKKENIHTKENEFKDFESLRKDFSCNLMYSNETFNFRANSAIDYFYYTDSKNTYYFSEKMSVIRAIASILGEITCEYCLAKLYGNNIENYEAYFI